MSVINTVRRQSFWAIDFLRGSEIKKRIQDITFILENYKNPQSVKLRALRLEKLISHAKETVPYYMEQRSARELSDFQVINKNLIRDNFDAFMSSEYTKEQLFSKRTSGSTGAPFQIFHHKSKKLQNTADTLYFAKKAGFQLGQKLIYLRNWGQNQSKNRFAAFMQNIYMHPVFNLKDEEIADLIQKITTDKSPKSMLSYASALTTICNYLCKIESPPLDVNMKSIIAMSEYLNPDIKEKLKYYFGVEGLSRYSNIENGIIAQQFPGSSIFHINWASYVVEILELDSNEPVALGKPGRIVITDLFNYCMPLIRYDTGDIGYMKNADPFNAAPYLEHVEGRKIDMIYNTKGELITSYITYRMSKYDKIKQFQFIQEERTTYIIKLNVFDDFNQQDYIVNDFKADLGQDANIRVVYVNDIPLLNSGKRKLVINKILDK